MLPVLAQALGKPRLVGVGEPPPLVDQRIRPAFQVRRPRRIHGIRQDRLFRLEREGLPQQRGDRAGKPHRAAGLARLDLAQVAQQMADAGLLQPIRRRPEETLGEVKERLQRQVISGGMQPPTPLRGRVARADF